MSSLTPEAYAIIEGRHSDPFRYLGAHVENGSSVVRVFLPDAEGVAVIDEQGHESELQRIHDAGLFEGCLANGPRHYRRRATASARSRSRIPTASRRSCPILISTCSAKGRICISTKSWVPIRWCSTAWRAWPLYCGPAGQRGWRLQSLGWTTPRHAVSGCTLGIPFLMRETCRRPCAKSTDPPRGYPHRELLVTGRAKFSCACGTPRSARQAGDPQI
jgi:hypothetical protein